MRPERLAAAAALRRRCARPGRRRRGPTRTRDAWSAACVPPTHTNRVMFVSSPTYDDVRLCARPGVAAAAALPPLVEGAGPRPGLAAAAAGARRLAGETPGW